jgi:aldehyde:ferredoxin oxidoreductase
MEYFAYAGNILKINLSNGEIHKEPLDLNVAQKLLGGWGLNYKFFYDAFRPGTDPFSPDNPIVIGAGPLIGTFVPGACKIMGTTKFAIPASDDGRHYITSASSGSRRFGLMLKNAGYDHLIITGQSQKPVYLKIMDDNIELCDAKDLWGKTDVYQTTQELIKKYKNSGIVAIGPAGENLVRFAMAFIDERNHFGRGGFGAVMGSKRLKAIVAMGTKGIKIADQQRFTEVIDVLRKRTMDLPILKAYRDMGVHALWRSVFLQNMNPGMWPKSEWDRLYGQKKWNEVKRDVKACSTCLMGCKVGYEVKDGKFAGLKTGTTHYLIAAVIGQKLDIRDHRYSLKLLDIMNRTGMCALTTSSIIDWVTRLSENGDITTKETNGLALKRDFKTYLELVNLISKSKGFGRILAEGWFETSKHLGCDARSYYITGFGIAKGTDCIYPGRSAKLDPMRFTMGITNPRGGYSAQGISATSAPLQPVKRVEANARELGTSQEALKRIFKPTAEFGAFNCARLTKHIEDFYSIACSLGLCTTYAARGLINIRDCAELYSSTTGLQASPEEIKSCGERSYNFYKYLNVIEGFTRKDDAFPEIWMKPMVTPDGVEVLTDYYRIKDLSKEDMNSLLDEYYDERGWDIKTGRPTALGLKELGLSGLINLND